MENSNLLFVCLTAFIGVFLVLGSLAGIMKLIMSIFPAVEEKTMTDSAIYAAIATTMSTIYPNTKVTKIEELK